MFKVKHIFAAPDVHDEREFERNNVQGKLAKYLQTNPMDRFEHDLSYREKVERTAEGLGKVNGFVLDIGGNTAGEATILQQKGYRMVVGDINEAALDISRQRAEKFSLISPHYVGLDAHNLPFKDGSFDSVTVLEALHHFIDYDRVLSEIFRVLKPGGKLFSMEPNALNPIRRASEVRDRLKGTIEKSFYPKQLQRLCEKAGFEKVAIDRHSSGKSTWKLEQQPLLWRPLGRFHGWLCLKFPYRFGGLVLNAWKPGVLQTSESESFGDLLCNSATGNAVQFSAEESGWVDAKDGVKFPDLNGIPILIDADKVPLKAGV